MRRKSFHLSLLLALSLALGTLFPMSAIAAEPTVNVKIAGYKVHLNGTTIDNAKAKYPVLVYKDITYFPMTWDYSEALGLRALWNAKTGLTINSGGSGVPLKQDTSGSNKLGASYKAKIASFPIKVNGVSIDNAKETYPVLQFRDITYFPMTWRFTNDFFGWETKWDSQTGYHIWGKQSSILSSYGIVHDDEHYLYVQTNSDNGIIAVSKALDGTFKRLPESEQQAIREKIPSKYRNDIISTDEPTVTNLIQKDGLLYYNEQSLVSLKPYEDKIAELLKKEPDLWSETGTFYHFYTNTVKLSEKLSLLTLDIYYFTHIPAPYTPFDTYVYVLVDEKAIPITGYTQQPNQIIKNDDGSFWIATYAPPFDQRSTYNFDMRGQLALIDKDGNSRIINPEFNATDIELLFSKDNSVIVKEYNYQIDSFQKLQTNGFYRLDSKGTKNKIATYVEGTAYVDQKEHIYSVNWNNNSITNASTKQSYRWWDYELLAK